jgi:hypothetical protein
MRKKQTDHRVLAVRLLFTHYALRINLPQPTWKELHMLQHMVMFKWKAGTTAQQLSQARAGLEKLAATVPGITSFSAGNQCSPEGLGKGFEFGFVMSFKDAASRDGYIVHPEHKKLVEFLLTIVEDVHVLDYEY